MKGCSFANKQSVSTSPEIEIHFAEGHLLQMIYIPPGKFRMGVDYSLLDHILGNFGSFDTPSSKVSITKGYYIGKYNVSCGIFADFLNSQKNEVHINNEVYVNMDKDNRFIQYEKKDGEFLLLKDKNDTVCTVSWPGSVAFCDWLSKKTEMMFRLPTEAEWDLAVRGANNRYDYIWKDFDRRCLTYDKVPNPVNPNGLHDVIMGNWCQDYFDFYTSRAKIDPKGPFQPGLAYYNTYGNNARVKRQPWVKNTSRSDGYFAGKEGHDGFRLCLEEDSVRKMIEHPYLLPKGIHIVIKE
jgi:formylglycine-generating enzyme required for sulfatase activity